jgi:hypothetical protein
VTTAEIMSALRARFAEPEHAFIPQVPCGTGGNAGRTADALAMSVWPSRGLILHGFEVKASRSDWLRELKAPAKAEEIAVFCDRWWLAVGDAAIVQPGELPATWGLLVPRGLKLVVKVEAPPIEARPIDRAFLAALLRQAARVVVPRAEVEATLASEREAMERRITERLSYELHAAEKRFKDLHARVTAFEQGSGVPLDKYSAERNQRIGAAVELVLDGGTDAIRQRLAHLGGAAGQIQEQIREVLEALPVEVPAVTP